MRTEPHDAEGSDMTDAPLDFSPIRGLITVETLRTALLDAMDRRGPAEAVFLASRRDGVVTGTVQGVEIDEDDDVVLIFDDRDPGRIGELWHAVEGLCDETRRQSPVFIRHARLGLIVGGLVGAAPDGDGDLTLEYDFLEDVLAQHADELAEEAAA
jgi:hypothetical protein